MQSCLATVQAGGISLPHRALVQRVGAALACLLALGAAPTRAQQVREMWVPNGPVSAVATANGLVYLGGTFTQLGPPIGAFVGLDAGSGAALQPYASVVGTVNAVSSDGSGGWYIGGQFAAVQGQPRQNLARLDAGGHVTSWAPTTSSSAVVNALSLDGGMLYVGGSFIAIDGQTRACLAAFDTTTGGLTAWNPGAFNAAGTLSIYALLTRGSLVYAGGAFTQVGGGKRNDVAALDATSGAALPWDPSPNGRVYALGMRSLAHFPFTVTVYIGGEFTTVTGQPRNQIASVDGDSGALNTWSPNATGTVRALFAGLTGPVYAAGDFTSIGGYPRNHVAALDSNTGVATSWDPNANYPVRGIALLAGTVYVCGDFSSIGGAARGQLAALDGTTGTATAWDARPNGTVNVVAAGGNSIWIGGGFTSVGGVTRRGLAALDALSGQPTGWAPVLGTAPIYGAVYSLVVSAGRLYAGGNFPSIDGLPRSNLAAFDLGTGGLLGWNPGATYAGSGGYIMSMAVSGGTVYVGGYLDTAGGLPRTNIAALDATTGAATAWNPVTTDFLHALGVLALAVSGNTVYAGGRFMDLGGQLRSSLASLDATTGAATAWNPAPSNGILELQINAIAPVGSSVYVGGQFNQLGGRPRAYLGVVDAVAGLATTWDPYADSPISALLPSGNTLFVGGAFGSLGGLPRRGLGALDLTYGSVTSWNPPALMNGSPAFGGVAQALATDGGSIYVGGAFLGVGGFARSNFVALTSSVLDVAGRGGPEPAQLRATPNPFRARVELTFDQPQAGDVEVAVYDIAGRRVRDLHRGALPAGQARLEWDGRDGSGGRVSAGVYLVRAQAGERTMTARVLRLE